MQESTSESLLKRIRNGDDESSWREFHDLYGPLIVRYAKGRGLRSCDAEDVAQDCMGSFVKALPDFAYDPSKGRFRNFLFRLANNAIADRFRRRRPRLARSSELNRIVDESAKSHAAWDMAWRREHLVYCLKRIESRFAPETMDAFRQHVLLGQSVTDVSKRLSLTDNQVYLAKSRVTRRLRKEMQALLGELD